MEAIAVLDFGSQYSQLITRRVREMQVYCELFPWDAPAETVQAIHPCGYILSGGPNSAYDPGAPFVPPYVLESGLPILGICYGMQALTHALGGVVAPSTEREYGLMDVTVTAQNPLLPYGTQPVWMSHGDRIERAPDGFVSLAQSANSPIAAMGNLAQKRYGLQFHPEVRHTPGGMEILRHFVMEICEAVPDWTPGSIIHQAVERIQKQVGDQPVLSAVSGGVDSSVATALVFKAIGKQLSAVFVDTGMLRHQERESVEEAFKRNLNMPLVTVDAVDRYLAALKGVTDPETKRRTIGELFIRIFEEEARRLGSPKFLVQGTIYPDVVESAAPDRAKGMRIKSHHNVGGLPKTMDFALVEPLRYLFKDEVRAVGEALGLPAELVWRQPFPGPGLAVRCLGEVNAERLARLRAADHILTGELAAAGLLRMKPDASGTAQAFAVLLPVQSVGVMGDQRTYQEAVALRAVTTDDFMTADWARLPHDLLARIANRIVNEVAGVNRVVYDITSKPPSTIEWE
ncbi:MAG TPA: glutamine-hydrolyzing GMP synthase [Anaerolineaceae bacterium]|nr:glutamine-hydrolyzing GMP synthase [Anaerolineaceae bacterium]HPN51038.1 glutamine-hydrolyzing GMP synthase [Anaerolineaceae bacterium]